MPGWSCRSRLATGPTPTPSCSRSPPPATGSRWREYGIAIRALRGAAMSDNLRLLGKYSDAMASGADDAVYEFFAPNFHSHVSERINPEVIGTDIRGSEQKWWREAKEAFPDMVFTVDLLIEQDDLIVSNWSVKGTHTGAPFNGIA